MDPIIKPYVPPQVLYKQQVQWVQQHSQPRQHPKPPKIDRGKKSSDASRIEALAGFLPRRKYIEPKNDPTNWVYLLAHPVKEAAKNYSPTGKISELAEPRWGRPPPRLQETRSSSPKRALAACSERTASLSTPRPRNIYKKFQPKPVVSESAKNYTASQLISKLAAPIDRKVELNAFAFTVNPIALSYRPSTRTRKMAKPHHIMTEQELQAKEAKHKQLKEKYDKKRTERLAKQKKAIMQRHVQLRKSQGI